MKRLVILVQALVTVAIVAAASEMLLTEVWLTEKRPGNAAVVKTPSGSPIVIADYSAEEISVNIFDHKEKIERVTLSHDRQLRSREVFLRPQEGDVIERQIRYDANNNQTGSTVFTKIAGGKVRMENFDAVGKKRPNQTIEYEDGESHPPAHE